MTGIWYSGESIGEPVLFAHRVDLAGEFSDLGDNWAVYDASGHEIDNLQITRVSTWAFEFKRGGVTKDLNVTAITAQIFTVTTEGGDSYFWNRTAEKLEKSDGSEKWSPAFDPEIEAVPGLSLIHI